MCSWSLVEGVVRAIHQRVLAEHRHVEGLNVFAEWPENNLGSWEGSRDCFVMARLEVFVGEARQVVLAAGGNAFLGAACRELADKIIVTERMIISLNIYFREGTSQLSTNIACTA